MLLFIYTVANKSAADAEKTKTKTPVKKAKPGPLSRKDKSKASPKETETGPSIDADKNKKPTEETPELATSTNADKSDKLTEETAPGTSTDAAKSETSTKGPEPADSNLGSTGECIFIKTEIEYSSGDDDNDATTEDDNGTKAGTSDPLATNWAMVYCATCKVLSEYVRTKTKRNCTNCQNPLFYQCTRCKKCLSTLQCLQTHIKVHEREEHHCEHCDFRTANKNVLQQHLETRHVTRGPFGREECPKCKRTYKSRKLMLMHNKRCGVTPEFKCGFCPYMAKTIMILRDHVKKRHISKEESVCECGKKFTNKKYFEKHQQNCDKAVPKRRF
ncbi:hypothetical protein TSAR_011827 [Trichomalopsis sarcophagae]|uniref:C2H2-type domain-containing protein n=1 Tax=Trichomalopsis sarcophagae TaxID=543379 RepID=A0A232F5N4_9HYME|nr:hypothetical protein TSAR_011827 [Trichomalopsis sarcophagae]